PEMRGLVSYAGERCVVLQDEDDLDEFLPAATACGDIFLCSQTTGSRTLFTHVQHKLRQVLDTTGASRLLVHDTICPVTERKEHEALRLQKKVDISFVIGDKLSSNATKLHRILAATGQAVYFIEDLDDLRTLGLPLERFRTALVVSAASTPEYIEKEVIDYLSSVQPLV
ncbi:MAG TPA: hypothetical protein ENN69_00335, partial [Spirochaetia bacterium]|nr:hypothetical protein [Spirochaetia bacterium]